jgi:hypothetical protein
MSGKFSIYSEVPEVFAISSQVPWTSSSLLPPLATPLLRRCTPAAGVSTVSPAMCCASVAPRRHLQLLDTPRVDPNPSAALAPPPWPSRARATPTRSSTTATSPSPWHCPCTPSRLISFGSRAALLPSLPIPFPFLLFDCPEPRAPPPPSPPSPAPFCSPWATASNPPRTTTTP